MNWGHPHVLWALAGPACITIALLVLVITGRRRGYMRWPGITRAVAIGATVHPISIGGTTRRPWLLVLAMTCAILALARPRWGTIDTPVVHRAREVMLALDLSKSMLTPDVPPARLTRAKLLVQGLLDGLHGERVGLIVFAGTSFVQVPLSSDYQILGEFLPELNPDYMPQGGTDYDGMLRAALGSFSDTSNTDRFLVVLSDGESTTRGWRDRIPELKKRGIRVIALGVGTQAGGFIPDAKTQGFIKDERGAVVLSHLEPATLQALASETNGAYREASAWVDLNQLLADTVEKGRQGTFGETSNKLFIERFQWFLIPAFFVALLGLWREIPARPRTRQIVHVPVQGPDRQAVPAAATSLAIVCLIVGLCLRAPLFAAVTDTTPASPLDQLKKTVSRLATAPHVSADGWRTMAEQTIALGEQSKSSGQPVVEGTVEDALAAVDAGEKMNPSAASWGNLRDKLLKLLEHPPQQDKKQDKDDKQQQQKQQNDKDSRQNQQQQQNQQQNQSQSKPDQGKPDSNSSSQQQQDQQQQKQPPPTKPPGQGGELGDLKDQKQPEAQPSQTKKEPPPPTRKFGGRPEGEPTQPPDDPEKAAELARLRKVTDDDSPARLQQLLEPTTAVPASRGRDW